MIDDGGSEFPMETGNDDLDAILFDGIGDTSAASLGLEAHSPSAIFDPPDKSLDHDAPKPTEPAEEVALHGAVIPGELEAEKEHPAASENSSQIGSPMEPALDFNKSDEAESLVVGLEETPHPRPLTFEIPLYPLSPDFRKQYEAVQSDIVDFILEELPDAPNDSLFRLEYTDGAQDTVSQIV